MLLQSSSGKNTHKLVNCKVWNRFQPKTASLILEKQGHAGSVLELDLASSVRVQLSGPLLAVTS